jgi:HSP20 family protein
MLNLTPWNQGKKLAIQRKDDNPFALLQREMNDVFNNFFRGDLASWGNGGEESHYMPRIDIADGEKEVRISAELPGMDEKDVQVSVTPDSVTLSGEKKIEKENHGKNCYHTEISYGSFKRVIPLPEGVDTNKAEATFKKGVLNVVLPKTPQAQSVEKKLTIKAE